MGKPSFSAFQSIVGLVAGLTSVCGAVYSAVQYVRPSAAPGEMVAVVHDTRNDRPIPGATVEVLTRDDTLVATITLPSDGLARHRLSAGTYRLRAQHPGFDAVTRDVEVHPGETAEVRLQLAQHAPEPEPAPHANEAPAQVAKRRTRYAPSPGQDAGRAIDRGVNATRRFFQSLF